MTEYHIGFTLKLEKTKKPFAIGKVFYNKGEHLIEFTDPDNANHMIKGLIPPYPESAQTPVEDKSQPEQTKQKEDSRGSGGIG